MKSYTLIILLLLQSCSLIKMETPYYKNDVGKAPRAEILPFKDKQALSGAATANNMTAAEIFYNGTEPKSAEAKLVWDLSYRFMDMLGIDSSVDINNPEAIDVMLENADTALKKKDEIIAKLEKDQQDFQIKLEGEKKINRDKEAQYEAESGKMKASMGSMFWGWIWTIVIVLIAALFIQIWSGIPIFTFLFKGGTYALGILKNGFKSTVKGVGDTIAELKETMEDEKATAAEKEEAKYWHDKLKENLDRAQDTAVKDKVKQIKEELKKEVK